MTENDWTGDRSDGREKLPENKPSTRTGDTIPGGDPVLFR